MALPDVQAVDWGQWVALAAALGWASGVRLYLAVFLVGAVGHLGWVPLPPALHLLQHPAVLAVAFVLLTVEFLADKVPWVDSTWDAVHTFIRIPAGAALAAGALGADGATLGLVGALLGGSLATTAHATKLTTRAAVNTSPEPFSNLAVSFLEEGLVVGALWAALAHPLWFGLGLAVVLAVSVALLVVLVRFARAAWRTAVDALAGGAASRA